MNLKDIAVFKHFIAGKSLHKPFINTYNGSREWAKLPKTIEEYLSNVEPLAVITKGCRICRPNSTYGYDFWQDLNEEWKEFYKKMQSSHFYESLTGVSSLSGYFSILRENWNDAEKPWKYESVEETRKRLGFELDEEDDEVEETQEPAPADPVGDAFSEDEEDDLDFFDVKVRPVGGKLLDNEATVNQRNSSYRVLFSFSISDKIRQKGFTYVRVAVTKDGRVAMRFDNNESGIKLTNLNTDNKIRNIHANSKPLCIKLQELFNMQEQEFFSIFLTLYREKDNYIDFIISTNNEHQDS